MPASRVKADEAARAIREALGRVGPVEVQARPADSDGRGAFDVTGALLLSATRVPLRVQAKSQASVRAVVETAARLRREFPDADAALGILVAPYVGDAVAAAAAEHGIGYVDLAGNAHIEHDTVYVHVRGHAPPPAEGRHVNLFAAKASRVIRALLADPDTRLIQTDIAARCGVSDAYVSRVVAALEEDGFVERGGTGVRMTDPEAMLDLWAAAYQRRRIDWQQWHAPARDAEAVASDITQAARRVGATVAFTGLFAAAHLAPYAYGGTVALYADEALPALLTKMGAPRARSNGDLAVNCPPWDDGVLMGARDIGSISIVHPIQVYLDLWRLGDRGREAAEVLRRECLEF